MFKKMRYIGVDGGGGGRIVSIEKLLCLECDMEPCQSAQTIAGPIFYGQCYICKRVYNPSKREEIWRIEFNERRL